jgi:hypothetical protein
MSIAGSSFANLSADLSAVECKVLLHPDPYKGIDQHIIPVGTYVSYSGLRKEIKSAK